MTKRTAYDFSPDELIGAFESAVAGATAVNVGGPGVMEVGLTAVYADQVVFLRGVLLARMEGSQPPYAVDDWVCLKGPLPKYSWRVVGVRYEGNGSWRLYLNDGKSDGHPASCFESVLK